MPLLIVDVLVVLLRGFVDARVVGIILGLALLIVYCRVIAIVLGLALRMLLQQQSLLLLKRSPPFVRSAASSEQRAENVPATADASQQLAKHASLGDADAGHARLS